MGDVYFLFVGFVVGYVLCGYVVVGWLGCGWMCLFGFVLVDLLGGCMSYDSLYLVVLEDEVIMEMGLD